MSLFDRMGRNMASMAAMMQKLGLDMEQLASDRRGLDLADAIRACRVCTAGEACCDWLAQTSGAAAQDAPVFCPNAERFARCLDQRG